MNLGNVIAVLAPLAIVAYWVTDTVKDLTNRNWNGLLTRLASFAGSITLVVLASHSNLNLSSASSSGAPAGLQILHGLGTGDVLLLALLISATGGTVFADGLKAINSSDTSTPQKMIPPPAEPPLAEQNAA